MRSRLWGSLCALLLVSAAQAESVQLKVMLTNGLGTGTSRKGDAVSAKVVEPAEFQGDTVEGKVTKVERGAGKAALRFTFETLKHGSQAVPIASEIQSIANSKGQADVDEDGYSISRTNSEQKASNLGRAGSALGGLLGGKGGAAVETAADKAAAAVILIDCASDGPSVTLAQGSVIVLEAKSRNSTDLASLAPNPASAGTATAPTAAGGTAPASSGQPAAQAAATGGQPDLMAVKSDFVPGDKVILYDDFTDMEGDEPPPHWKVRGGTAELRVGGGVRQMTMTADRLVLTPNVTALPANFTMEADVAYKGHGARTWWQFFDKAGEVVLDLIVAVNYDDLSLDIKNHEDQLTTQSIPMDWTKPVKQALWTQNGRIRFYINGKRVMDVNQIALPELGKVELNIDGPGDNDREGYVGIQFFRIAESSPDFGKLIMSSGRYVTHGILFDTDSDRIRPESGPVIRIIAKGLEADPALKLRIEGHTDASGAAAHNMELSKKRAEAVKAVLVSQFKIDPARLTTDGLGSSKPIDTNDTPQGRAQNRRVEFVKQ